MTRVVLAASQSASDVAVIDFTTPSVPHLTLVPIPGNTGYTVALSGSLGAIGSYPGTTAMMRTINVTNPAAPVLGVPIPIRLSGIGAIAVDPSHTHVALGERTGGHVMLVGIEGGTSEITAPTAIGQITSVAFFGPEQVAVSGQNAQVALINFSVTPPQVTHITPAMGANLTVACDVGLIAVGDHENAIVKLYAASNPNAPKAEVSDGLPGTSSIGLSGESALCGAMGGEHAALVNFANRTSQTFPADVSGGGAIVSRSGPEGVCGGRAGVPSAAVALFNNLAVGPPKLLGVLERSGIPSIQSIGLGVF